MIQLTPVQYTTLRDWFLPEKPGPLIGLHVLNTGHGTILADRWPQPRALFADTAGNSLLTGDSTALTPADLHGLVGMINTSISFVPLLQTSFADLRVWDRVVFSLHDEPQFTWPAGYEVRPVTAVDTPHLQSLSSASSWIAKTWGGADGLAASGMAWGAWENGRLAAIACTFFLGDQIEELGVATEPEHRGRGLSAACAGPLCQDIRARGRSPSWTTSPDNIASLRVAQKLGFTHHHDDVLYVIGVSIPKPPTRS
jgi:RimJ/RimL family protein N-acetyltransferase